MLYTFFFGYFSLKWRRLIRFVISPVIVFLLIILNAEVYYQTGILDNFNELMYVIILFCSALPELAFISWIIKPFVVKE